MTRRQIVLALVVISIVVWLWIYRAPVPPWMKDWREVLPIHPTAKFSRRAIAAIDSIVVHHTAGPATQSLQEIASYHVQPGNHICSSGCPAISYHVMIDRQANAYLVNDLENISYHATPANSNSVGVCFVGNYERIEPTTAQIRRFRQVVRWLEGRCGRKLEIMLHKQVSSRGTACPGKHIAAKIAIS